MSAEPLSREERERLMAGWDEYARDFPDIDPETEAEMRSLRRYEATVQAVEAERDTLAKTVEAMWNERDALTAKRDALARRVEALRAGLEEITSPPDASHVGADYGCLDFHEAKFIATHALAADDEAAA